MHTVGSDERAELLLQFGTDFVGHRIGGLAGSLHVGEHHNGEIALKLLAGFLHQIFIYFDIKTIQIFQHILQSGGNQ